MRVSVDGRSVLALALGMALCALLIPASTSGQGLVWERTGGPSGGVGYDIKARPDNPDVMYATDAFAGVHKTMDGGLTWRSVNRGIRARSGAAGDHIPAFSVTVDPNQPHVVWVGMQNSHEVYRSIDAGETWEPRGNGIVEVNSITVRGITVQPGNSDVVYIAGEIPVREASGRFLFGRLFSLSRGVVYKSVDAGLNWTAVWRGDNLARYVIVDPSNVDTVYVSTGIFDREAANSRPEFNEPGGVGVLKSTDGGASWATINDGLGNLYVGSLVMDPRDPRRLLASTGVDAYSGGGVYLTIDGGASWRSVGGPRIGSVEFSASNPAVAYAAGDSRFFRSSDGGQTWTSYLNRAGRSWGPLGISVGFPIDVHVDPRDPQRLFVNNYGGGNFLTTDGGVSWATASTGYTGADVKDVAVSRQNPAVVYANTQAGPFKSMDGGQTWSGINPIDLLEVRQGGRIAVDPEDGGHVIMASSGGGTTYETFDGGATWRLVTDYQTEILALPRADYRFQGMQALAFAPSWRLKVYGGFGHARCIDSVPVCDSPTIVGALTSEDGGRTWLRRTGTGFDTSTVQAVAVHPLNHEVAWVATMDKGVFKTNDGGTHWSAVSTGLADLRVESLAVDPTRPEILYAGTRSRGVYKSRDGGGTWTAAGAGLKATEEIRAVVVNPVRPDVVYVGAAASGVYASSDGGASWALVNDGLRNRDVRTLAISADGRVLYAGTYGEGVFRLGAAPSAAPAPE